MGIYNQIIESKKEGRKLFSILIDPDKQTEESLLEIIKKSRLHLFQNLNQENILILFYYLLK